MEETKLERCPFCGSDDVDVYYQRAGEYFGSYVVECNRCISCGSHTIRRDVAIKNWNRRASGWISVSDRLPDDNWHGPDDLLLVSASGEIFAGHFCDRIFWRNAIYMREGTSTSVPIYRSGNEVTHWQPLPKPPEQPTAADTCCCDCDRKQGWRYCPRCGKVIDDAKA